VAQALDALKLCPLLATPEFARKADRLLVNIVGGTDLTLAKVNEIMTAVTEQFGRDAHVIMGAVIDEDLQGRLEIVVLGTSDIGGARALGGRRPARARASAPSADELLPLPAPEPARAPVGASAPARSVGPKGRSIPADQDEFRFGEIEVRGSFEQTDRNLFEGQDLDVPTYLRKGIKIAL